MTTQAEFYREWLKNRDKFDPQQFDVDMDREKFIGKVIKAFCQRFPDWTVDELLYHPRDAERFCYEVRHDNGWYDVPDDIILRSLKIFPEQLFVRR